MPPYTPDVAINTNIRPVFDAYYPRGRKKVGAFGQCRIPDATTATATPGPGGITAYTWHTCMTDCESIEALIHNYAKITVGGSVAWEGCTPNGTGVDMSPLLAPTYHKLAILIPITPVMTCTSRSSVTILQFLPGDLVCSASEFCESSVCVLARMNVTGNVSSQKLITANTVTGGAADSSGDTSITTGSWASITAGSDTFQVFRSYPIFWDEPTTLMTALTAGASSATQTVASTAGMSFGDTLFIGAAVNAKRTVKSITNATTVVLDSTVDTTGSTTAVITWATNRVYRLQPGHHRWTNPVDVYVASGAQIGIHDFYFTDVASQKTPVGILAAAERDGIFTGSGNDRCDQDSASAGSNLSSNGADGNYYRVPYIIATPRSSAVRCVGIVGDSVLYGGSDPGQQQGYAERAIKGAGHTYLNVACPNEDLHHVGKQRFSKRMELIKKTCDGVIINYGQNDLPGQSVTTFINDLTAFLLQFQACGLPVLLIPPLTRTVSTDSWATTANQAQVSLNTTLRFTGTTATYAAGSPIAVTANTEFAAGDDVKFAAGIRRIATVDSTTQITLAGASIALTQTEIINGGTGAGSLYYRFLQARRAIRGYDTATGLTYSALISGCTQVYDVWSDLFTVQANGHVFNASSTTDGVHIAQGYHSGALKTAFQTAVTTFISTL